jgi:hypothetical protein
MLSAIACLKMRLPPQTSQTSAQSKHQLMLYGAVFALIGAVLVLLAASRCHSLK